MAANSSAQRAALRSIVLIAVAALFVLTISVPLETTVAADEKYATGISSGKTKPLIDIENKLMGPGKARPIKKATPETTGKLTAADTSRVEDASKYKMYIEPVFPRKARLVNKEAIVEVNITFDDRGKMKDARIVSCTTPNWGFEQAVLAAALEARLSGHGDREVTVKAKLKFELQD
jgi:outer membrane biosynthesis protein TonB